MKTTVNKNISHKQKIKKIKKKLTRAIASASPPLTAQPINLTTNNVQISPQNTSNTQTTQFKQTDIQNLPPYHATELQNPTIRSNFTQCYPIFPPKKLKWSNQIRPIPPNASIHTSLATETHQESQNEAKIGSWGRKSNLPTLRPRIEREEGRTEEREDGKNPQSEEIKDEKP